MKPTILLSYDVEEFDMPFEYNGNLPIADQLSITTTGLERLLQVLDKYEVKATFYCTAKYATLKKAVIQNLHQQGHEIASHAFNHSAFENADLLNSKQALEEIIQHPVYGFRMPRMAPVDKGQIKAAGYFYSSSINPTWIPGRYNHLKAKRTFFSEAGLWQLPASVTPLFRIPLFWLSFHNFPFWFYWQCCTSAIKKDNYLNLYFHPWEFVDYKNAGGAKFPSYVTRNAGNVVLQRTEQLIINAKKKGFAFDTTINWLKGNDSTNR
ncbi:MAG: polysaccharide deacetylase family protein [Chitinophagaceae bacterium]|nr:polysaccharide deacetylase family protein [Chitinophagaceae bacterium]